MLKTRTQVPNRLILDNISWNDYIRLSRIFDGRHLRMTYDRGTLEIMTLTLEHETNGDFLGLLVRVLTEELNLPIRGGGSTTFRRRKKEKGLEPDRCYWIANEAAVRIIKRIDLRTDPPPDLALEIDITSGSMNRMPIYAAIKVPEVWRYDKKGLSFWVLNAAGGYDAAAVSPTFPIAISPADLVPFLGLRDQMDDNAVIRQFRAWIKAKAAAGNL